MEERGVSVDHSTINRWSIRFWFCRVVNQTAEIGRKLSYTPYLGRNTPAIAENWSAIDITLVPSISN